MTKKRLVVGNWKMYIESPEEARALALGLRRKVRGLSKLEVWVAPPMPFVAEVAEVLASSSVKVGAQTVSAYEAGAHTGGVSATMIKKTGGLFAVVGHSERRAEGLTNEGVRAALEQAAAVGLTPILCVGEREREAEGEHFEFIAAQLESALATLPPRALKKLVIAYEPVWAIGRGAEFAIEPEALEEMVIFIRKTLSEVLDRRTALRVPVLYGGSVDASNAAGLLAEGGVSGFLVGRASTTLEQFVSIINACK